MVIDRTNIRISWLACGGTILATILPLLAGEDGSTTMDNDAQTKFQIAYRATSQPNAKLELVIKAIDAGVIKAGLNQDVLTLSDVNRLFGGALENVRIDPERKTTTAITFFEPVIPPLEPLNSNVRKGWYLHLFFRGDRLEYYSLSNLHQSILPGGRVLVKGDENTKKDSDAQTKFQTVYAATSQPYARRDLVIKAVNDGVIRRGIKLTEVKHLFDGELRNVGFSSAYKKTTATVFFEPVIPAPEPMMSALQEGWYINFFFLPDDSLEYYSLSNLHKFTLPKGRGLIPAHINLTPSGK